MATTEITGKATMQDVLAAYPAAKQVLFERYHVGGCSSCGYAPTDTLDQVLAAKGVLDLEEAITHIKRSQETMDKLQIAPKGTSEASGGKESQIDRRSDRRGKAPVLHRG